MARNENESSLLTAHIWEYVHRDLALVLAPGGGTHEQSYKTIFMFILTRSVLILFPHEARTKTRQSTAWGLFHVMHWSWVANKNTIKSAWKVDLIEEIALALETDSNRTLGGTVLNTQAWGSPPTATTLIVLLAVTHAPIPKDSKATHWHHQSWPFYSKSWTVPSGICKFVVTPNLVADSIVFRIWPH